MPRSTPASKHEQTAAAAERVRKTVEGQDLLEQMREAIKQIDAMPVLPSPLVAPDCGCSKWSPCMNVNCPRRYRVTC